MEKNQVQQDLASIRNLMERSSKFISLSGLSGILAGVYALAGTGLAYYLIYIRPIKHAMPFHGFFYSDDIDEGFASTIIRLIIIALVVLVAAVTTGLVLSMRKARQNGVPFWGPSSRALAFNLIIPLLTGGAFIFIFLWRGYFETVASASLIFYGLALIGAGNYTFKGVQYLGINEIILGLIAALFPGWGLLLWAIGFGALHIIYGSVMYIKYDR